MSFVSSNLSDRIGTVISTDKGTLLRGERATNISQLLETRGVLVFPALNLSDEEQLEFSRTLGEVIDQGERGIYKVTLDPRITPTAEYLHATIHWHFDGWADDVPARGSILSARVLSKVGGQTEFANTYAAYDDLPQEKKVKIEGLKVFHTMAGTQRDVFDHPTAEMRARWESYPARLHPLVWTHRSGRKSLLLGSSADWIDGMDKREGRALIAELQAWATQPRFVYRHHWNIGDMLIWDNCGALHRVEPYLADSGRLMHRVTLKGQESIN